jgi:hypothetical protein
MLAFMEWKTLCIIQELYNKYLVHHAFSLQCTMFSIMLLFLVLLSTINVLSACHRSLDITVRVPALSFVLFEGWRKILIMYFVSYYCVKEHLNQIEC